MKPILRMTCLLVLGLSLIGCSVVPVTRWYTLTTLANEAHDEQNISPTPGLAIGVGPVELPEYLDRPQIMTNKQGNELWRAEFDYWAEPLRANFIRVLAANLSTLLRTERVAVFPWKGPVPLDYQVVVEVTQFIGNLDDAVSMVALWRILNQDGRAVLTSRQSRISEPLASPTYPALVAAMSRALANLSHEIANVILNFKRP